MKKLVGFRVDEEKWEGFHRLVNESRDTVQSVLANFVEACLETKSVEVTPIHVGKSGRELSHELRLREIIQKLQSAMRQRKYLRAETKFSELTYEVQHIRDVALLEEAKSGADAYLKWVEGERKTSSYMEGGYE